MSGELKATPPVGADNWTPFTVSCQGVQKNAGVIETYGAPLVPHLDLWSSPTEHINAPLEDGLNCMGTNRDLLTIGPDVNTL